MDSIDDGNHFTIPLDMDSMEDLRLPKKRRYCGEDSSRHVWDNRGIESTEPPTPDLIDQPELADVESRIPFAHVQRSVSSYHPAPSSGHRIHLPVGALSGSGGKPRGGDGSPGSSVARVRWHEGDDKLLIQLVSEFGHNWPLIASRMDGRTSKQVKERWTNQLDPTISTEPWTAEDDQLLVELIREVGHSWCEISRRMRGRTESMVKNRFHANLRKRFGPQIFDPAVPLPVLSFKPKSLKSKKTVISNEVRLAAAVAAEKAADMGKPSGPTSGRMLMSRLPPASSYFTSPADSEEQDN